jgi:HK97 family phage major capsid protein
MDIASRISAKKDRLVSIKDDLTVLKGLLDDESYELNDDEQERITILTEEEESVIKSIEALEKLEQGIAAKSAPVVPVTRGVAPGPAAKVEKGGSLMAKFVTAQLFAKKHEAPLETVIDQLYGNDERVRAIAPMLSEKTAVPSADTTTTGWAKELVSEDVDAFMRDLQPISVYAALRARGRGLNFGGMSSLKIPRRSPTIPASANNDLSGAFVGEGGVIPVKRAQVTSQTLNPYKLAVISAWTNELDARSTPQIEGLVRDMILEDTARTLDAYLLDNSAQVNNIRPAGLLNGVTGNASAGVSAANIITDLKVLFASMQAARVGANPVMIMNSIRLLGLSTITTAAGGFMFRDEVAAGRLLGVPVIAADHVPANVVVIVDAGSFVAANDTPQFSISDQAVLTMANADGTAPTQAEAAALDGSIGNAEQVPPDGGINVGDAGPGGAGAPGIVGAAPGVEAVSLWQTYQTAIRMVLPTSWGMVRPNAVDSLTGVNW